MKKTIIIIVLLQLSVFTFSHTWVSDPVHSRLGFTISNLMVLHVTGNFKQFEVKVVSTKPDYSDAIQT